MASKVNTRFVVILGASVVGVLGALLGVAYVLLYNTPEELVKMGDRSMADGKYIDAAIYYSKACDKEKTNPENYKKWRESVSRQVPETPTQFDAAMKSWRGATRQLAVIQPQNLDAQKEYLETLDATILQGPFDRTSMLYVREESQLFLTHYAGQDPGPWEVLKRYRGLAQFRILAETPDAPAEDWQTARSDLEAAVRVDPSDFECATSLEALLREQGRKARIAGKTLEADELDALSKKVFDDFQARNPGNPMAILGGIQREFNDALTQFRNRHKAAADAGQPLPDLTAEGTQIAERLSPRLDEALAAAKQSGAASVTPLLIRALREMERTVDPRARYRRTSDLITFALESRPQDLDLLSAKAEVAGERDEFELGVQYLQTIIDMPNRPVSIDGQRLFGFRTNARILQAQWAVRAYLATPDEKKDEKVAARQRARDMYDYLQKNEDRNSPRVMLVQAWNSFIDNDPQTADRLLSSVNSKQRILDPDVLVLWAHIATQLNQPGAARERLLMVLQVQPNHIPAALALGQLSNSLQDFETAENLFTNILRVLPDNEMAQEGVRIARAGRGSGTPAESVQQVLMDVQREQREGVGKEGTDATVNTILTEAVTKYGYAPQLIHALVTARLNLGDREGALTYVRTGIEKNPDSVLLKSLETMLTTEDQTDANIKIIEARTDIPELNRVLAKFQWYRTAGRKAEARAMLDRAIELNPDDDQVIEVCFIDALERADWAKASEMADKAGKLNIDRAEGRTFKARQMASQRDQKGAAEIMQQVIDSGTRTPEVYRLLGRLQMALGRLSDATNSFKDALRLRPNDSGAIKDLVTALVTQNLKDQALQAAREGEKFAGNDPEFLDLWLKIEAEFGNLPLAIQRRERMALANPNDRDNLYELGRLQIRTGDLPKARTTIDRVRTLRDDFEGMALEASWHWAKNDRAAAKKTFEDFNAKMADNPARLRAHIEFAQFLYGRKDFEGAISNLEAARTYQDPKVMEADKAIADVFFAQAVLDRAAVPLAAIVASGADSPDQTYRKKLVESLIRLKKLDEAEEAIRPLISVPEPELVCLLLEADLREAQLRDSDQRQILDRVVSKYPTEAAVFVKRGQYLARTESTWREAIQDFSKAIQLSPNMWQAFRLRAALYGRMKDADRALTDLREALRLNPQDDEMLVSLVTDLIRRQRDQEAEDAAKLAIDGRPREALTYQRVGNMFQSVDRPAIAARFLKSAFELDPNDLVVQRYLDSLLAQSPPDITTADAVLRQIGEERVKKNPGFLMALSRVRLGQQNRINEAVRAATDALRLLDPANVGGMLQWHNDMDKVIPEGAKHLKFVEDAIAAGIVPTLNEWLAFFRAEIMSRNPPSLDAAAASLGELLNSTKNPPLRLLCFRLRGTAYYAAGKSSEAEAVWRTGVAEFPDDAEMNNNLAYLMAQAGKFDEALPMAQKAAELRPTSPDVLDTLGYIYMRTGKLKDAEQTLRRSLQYMTQGRQAVVSAAHLAETLYRLERFKEAKDMVDEADNLAKAMTQLDQAVVKELQDVRTLIEQPR
ncbi:hypothetical protein PHYC_01690 [Phycisphaerales bacterium]|nr:hypothetical protein PHYC_01690 [Phycisphaerales bacterium]